MSNQKHLLSDTAYLFFAYKPDSCWYGGWGATEDYPHDFWSLKTDVEDDVVDLYAACLAVELRPDEVGFTTLELYGPSPEAVARVKEKARARRDELVAQRRAERAAWEAESRAQTQESLRQARRQQYEKLRLEFENEPSTAANEKE